MKRRSFLKKAAVGLAAGAVAAPAIAQSQPTDPVAPGVELSRRALDTIIRRGRDRSRSACPRSTDGKFQIRVFAAGEIVPGLQVLDAVQNGTVECGHTAPYYYIGKDPAFAFATALPFGLNARQQNAWMYYGGGLEAVRGPVQGLRLRPVPGRQHRRPDGRLVPQGDQERRGPEGPQVPHRRARRPGARQARRGGAADRGRRHLPGARARHHRRRGMGRPLRRREARLPQGRQVLLLPRLVGGRPAALHRSSTSRSGTSCPSPTRRRSRRPARKPTCTCWRATTPRTPRRCGGWSRAARSCGLSRGR